MSGERPKFVSVHKTYMPAFGERNQYGGHRYQPRPLTAVDEDGNLWGLYDDIGSPSVNGVFPIKWVKYIVEAVEP